MMSVICAKCKGTGKIKHQRLIVDEHCNPQFHTVGLINCDLCGGLGFYNLIDSIKRILILSVHNIETSVKMEDGKTEVNKALPPDEAIEKYKYDVMFHVKVDYLLDNIIQVLPKAYKD